MNQTSQITPASGAKESNSMKVARSHDDDSDDGE